MLIEPWRYLEALQLTSFSTFISNFHQLSASRHQASEQQTIRLFHPLSTSQPVTLEQALEIVRHNVDKDTQLLVYLVGGPLLSKIPYTIYAVTEVALIYTVVWEKFSVKIFSSMT